MVFGFPSSYFILILVLVMLLLPFLLLLPLLQARPLTDSTLGLTEIDWSWEPSQIYLGSPSILRLSNGDILASADRFGTGFQTERNVSVYRSTDD